MNMRSGCCARQLLLDHLQNTMLLWCGLLSSRYTICFLTETLFRRFVRSCIQQVKLQLLHQAMCPRPTPTINQHQCGKKLLKMQIKRETVVFCQQSF